MTYSLTFTKKPDNSLLVDRKIRCQRTDIPAAQYQKFREFMLAVAEAESKVLAFK